MADYRSPNDYDTDNAEFLCGYIGKSFPHVKREDYHQVYKVFLWESHHEEFYAALDSVNPGVDKVQLRLPFGEYDIIFCVLSAEEIILMKLKTNIKLILVNCPEYSNITGELKLTRAMV
jgi:hypothetical protein